MSLDKAILHGKEHRKPYRGAKAIDGSCRNHGGCPWCEGNRRYQADKDRSAAEQDLKDFVTQESRDGDE